jgi:hypothetical protein
MHTVFCGKVRRNAYGVLWESQKEIDHYEDRGTGGEITVKCIREIGWGGMNWINLALDIDQWLDLVKTIMNLQVQ